MIAPTDSQKRYIESLIERRDVPVWLATEARAIVSKSDASAVIDKLLKCRYLARPAAARPGAAVSPEFQAYLDAINAVEVSKYAVPTLALNIAIPEFKTSGDLLFLEVKNYMGKRQFARLSGAPGRFNRYRIPRDEATMILRYIAGRHVEFAKLFADHYKVCGRCAAELTDQTSRDLGFGPQCAKIFNLV